MGSRQFLLPLIVACAGIARSADCDCAHFPIKPEACVRVCQAVLLQKATREDLTGKVRLNSQTAAAIIRIQRANQSEMKSFSALKSDVTTKQAAEITVKLDDLNESDTKALLSKYRIAELQVKDDGKIEEKKME